jgi:hypothetical protein
MRGITMMRQNTDRFWYGIMEWVRDALRGVNDRVRYWWRQKRAERRPPGS